MSQLSERSYRRATDPDMVEAINELVTFWNSGRYQARVLTAAPTHTGTNGEFFFVNLGGTKWLYAWMGAWLKVEMVAA